VLVHRYYTAGSGQLVLAGYWYSGSANGHHGAARCQLKSVLQSTFSWQPSATHDHLEQQVTGGGHTLTDYRSIYNVPPAVVVYPSTVYATSSVNSACMRSTFSRTLDHVGGLQLV